MRALWMARRANFPMRNARKLQALFRAGQLEVLSGYVDSRHDAAGGFVTACARRRASAARSRYLINATSFSVDAAGAADPLVSALLRDGHGQAHRMAGWRWTTPPAACWTLAASCNPRSPAGQPGRRHTSGPRPWT